MYRNIRRISVRRISIRKRNLFKARNQIKSERRKKRDVDYDTYSQVTMCRTPTSSTTTIPSINKISPMFMNITTIKRNKNNEKRRRRRRCPALWIFMCPFLCMLTSILIGILTYSIITMIALKSSTIATTRATFTTITTATMATTATTITSTTATGTTVIATTTVTTTIATTIAATSATTDTTTIGTTIAATSATTTAVNACGQPPCSISPDPTLYPNTCDCHQYFRCVNYVRINYVCTTGTDFDYLSGTCKFPPVTCGTG